MAGGGGGGGPSTLPESPELCRNAQSRNVAHTDLHQTISFQTLTA